MHRKSPDQQLLDASRTQRQLFLLRFGRYSSLQRYLTSKAAIDYANKLSAEIGRMPDTFLFGRDILSSADAEQILLAMGRHEREAEESASEENLTACLALLAMANLVALRHVPARPSVQMQAAHAFEFMLAIMDGLISDYVSVQDVKGRLN